MTARAIDHNKPGEAWLSHEEGERLTAPAAWPCALVESSCASGGFVMSVIPDSSISGVGGLR